MRFETQTAVATVHRIGSKQAARRAREGAGQRIGPSAQKNSTQRTPDSGGGVQQPAS